MCLNPKIIMKLDAITSHYLVCSLIRFKNTKAIILCINKFYSLSLTTILPLHKKGTALCMSTGSEYQSDAMDGWALFQVSTHKLPLLAHLARVLEYFATAVNVVGELSEFRWINFLD
jgi:hypothetical protein